MTIYSPAERFFRHTPIELISNCLLDLEQSSLQALSQVNSKCNEIIKKYLANLSSKPPLASTFSKENHTWSDYTVFFSKINSLSNKFSKETSLEKLYHLKDLFKVLVKNRELKGKIALHLLDIYSSSNNYNIEDSTNSDDLLIRQIGEASIERTLKNEIFDFSLQRNKYLYDAFKELVESSLYQTAYYTSQLINYPKFQAYLTTPQCSSERLGHLDPIGYANFKETWGVLTRKNRTSPQLWHLFNAISSKWKNALFEQLPQPIQRFESKEAFDNWFNRLPHHQWKRKIEEWFKTLENPFINNTPLELPTDLTNELCLMEKNLLLTDELCEAFMMVDSIHGPIPIKNEDAPSMTISKYPHSILRLSKKDRRGYFTFTKAYQAFLDSKLTNSEVWTLFDQLPQKWKAALFQEFEQPIYKFESKKAFDNWFKMIPHREGQEKVAGWLKTIEKPFEHNKSLKLPAHLTTEIYLLTQILKGKRSKEVVYAFMKVVDLHAPIYHQIPPAFLNSPLEQDQQQAHGTSSIQLSDDDLFIKEQLRAFENDPSNNSPDKIQQMQQQLNTMQDLVEELVNQLDQDETSDQQALLFSLKNTIDQVMNCNNPLIMQIGETDVQEQIQEIIKDLTQRDEYLYSTGKALIERNLQAAYYIYEMIEDSEIKDYLAQQMSFQ